MDNDDKEIDCKMDTEDCKTKNEEVDTTDYKDTSNNMEIADLQLNTGFKDKLNNSVTIEPIINEYTHASILENIEKSLQKNEDSIVDTETNLKTKNESCAETEFKENKEEVFDSYVDNNNKVYRKYRFREQSKKPDYRIPSVNDLPDLRIRVPKVYTQCTKSKECKQCKKVCKNYVEFREHMKKSHEIVFTCAGCNRIFTSNTDLITHKETHETEDRSYLCHKCKQAFTNHCDFLLHQQRHFKANSSCKCPECGLSYHYNSYKKHIYSHFNKPLKCPICSKECNGDFNLQAHINKHSSSIECIECGKVLDHKSQYEQHLAIHTGVKLHQCLYCGKSFRLIQQRKVHTRIHTNDKPYSCDKCKTTFVQYTDQQRHMKKCYNKEKDLECDICKKRFRDKFNIASHMKVHLKQYKCPECGKYCSSVAGLKQHILYVHSADRPEICTLCNLKYVNKTQLRRHYNSKSHKNNVFKVNNCKE